MELFSDVALGDFQEAYLLVNEELDSLDPRFEQTLVRELKECHEYLAIIGGDTVPFHCYEMRTEIARKACIENWNET